MIVHRLSGRLRSLAALALGAFACARAVAQPAPAVESVPGAIQFESLPASPTAATVSFGFAATGTDEVADLIRLDGDAHFLGRVSVAMTNSARASEFHGASPLGFSHPITVTFYSVDRNGPTPQTGAVLARVTETFLIPWQPEIGATGPARVFTITFDLAPLGLALPSEIIVGVSLNTQFRGRTPLGKPGAYDRLGLILTASAPTIGADLEVGALFRKASAGDAENLWPDSHWAPFTLALRVQDSAFGVLFETATRLDALHGPDAAAARAANLAASMLTLALDREFWDGNNQLSPYGIGAFDLLADATNELSAIASGTSTLAIEAHAAIATIANVATFLSEAALGDALILGGDADALLRAEAALDLALELKTVSERRTAIDAFGEAWEEAQAALR